MGTSCLTFVSYTPLRMVRRWPTLVTPISLSSSCRSAIRASPTISFSGWEGQRVAVREDGSVANVPKKLEQYCGRPRPLMKPAHSSAVHSVMMVRGEEESPSMCPKVVGVFSVEGGSDSVWEVSSSVATVGEVIKLRSYSSSASESAA